MLNYVPIDAVVTFDVTIHDPDTGGIHAADSAPVYDVFEDTNDTPILSAQSTTVRSGKTGDYRGTFTCSAANGFEVDKSYNVVVSGTITGTVSAVAITGKKVALIFRCAPAVNVAGIPLVDTTKFAGQTITAPAGVTLPSSVASPTNITAGILTTVGTATNLTNAPSNGDLTAAMKSSITTAATASTPVVSPASVVASVTDISSTPQVELSGVPLATATIKDMLKWLFLLSRNKITQGAISQIVKADNGTTDVATSVLSDDGTTAIRGEFT